MKLEDLWLQTGQARLGAFERFGVLISSCEPNAPVGQADWGRADGLTPRTSRLGACGRVDSTDKPTGGVRTD
jgi:hypothetical protein